jgi:flagellar basal body P-ring formation protein FlgA
VNTKVISAQVHKFTKYEHTRFFCSCVLVILCSCIFFVVSARADNQISDEQKISGLQVYLPREVTVESETLEMGHVGVVIGDETLVKRANAVGLGRFSTAGQEIVLEKAIILSRLVSSGIPAAQITFKGAEKVIVKRQKQIISGSEIVRQAKLFLSTNTFANSVESWNSVREPAEFVLADKPGDISYSFAFIDKNVKKQVTVEVAVISGGKKLGTRNVTFTPQYTVRNAVTIADISAGEVISPENVRIDAKTSSQPQTAGWVSPYGLVAKRSLPADTVIRTGMIGSAEPATVIKRNQNVVIKIESSGFVITAVGKALQDGKVDELIKVRNVDSQRIIVAKVMKDMTVEPVL